MKIHIVIALMSLSFGLGVLVMNAIAQSIMRK